MNITLEDIKSLGKDKRRRHKFGAVSCQRGQIKFPSKLERRMYDKLVQLQKAGEVVGFLRQPGFDLAGGVRYFADFQVFWSDGTVQFIDTKGRDTTISAMKRKMVEAEYPWVKIEIVTKV